MSWLRRRASGDVGTPESEAPEPPRIRPWTTYAGSFSVLIRETDERGETPYDRAVAAGFIEIDVDLPLEEFVPEVEQWLAEQRGDFFEVEIRRTYHYAGASGVGAELLITFLGTTAGTVVGLAIYDALLAFVKQRLGLGDRPGGTRIKWLRSLDEADAENYLAARVARVIDRSQSDLALVQFVLDEKEARAVYDVNGDRYEVRVDETAYRIVRVEPPVAPERQLPTDGDE